MELRNDDLQPVTLLANSFSEVLQTSRTKTERIEELLKKISKHTDSNTEQLFQPNPDSSNDTQELDELDKLRSENLELMMEIERQNYLSKKWNQVLQQNENILKTVKVWISENPDLLEKNTIELENQYYEIESHYKTSIRGLEYEIKQSRECIDTLLVILRNFEQELILKENNVGYYNGKRKELVQAIQKLERLQK